MIKRLLIAAFALLLPVIASGQAVTIPPYTTVVQPQSNSGSGGGGGTAVGTVNGVLNVKDAQFHALGDCTTDDTTSIQSAIDVACAASSIQPVYLPPTSTCYNINQPLRLHCSNVRVFGGGTDQTRLTKSFNGPTFIVQNTTGWIDPFVSSVTAAWASAHTYAQYDEIKDSNGNIEVATTGGLSGGSAPAWGTTQGGTKTDNAVTWTLESVGTQLMTGTGSAFDGLACVARNLPLCQLFGGLDLSEAAGAMNINGLSNFTAEATVNLVYNNPGAFQTQIIVASQLVPAFPQSGNDAISAFGLSLQGANVDQPTCTINVAGVAKTVQGTALSTGQTHHLACVLDGTGHTVTLWVDGVSAATTAATGTITSTPKEAVNILDSRGLLYARFSGYIDSVRLSSSARYTTAFTAPTAKYTLDGNTIALFNWAASTTPGTIEGQGSWANLNIFLPVETGSASVTAPGNEIDHLAINSLNQFGAGPGIWAAWAYNGSYHDLSDAGQGGGTDVCIDLHDNDFQTSMRHLSLDCSGKFAAQFAQAIYVGSQSGGVTVDDAQLDGTYLSVGVNGPSDAGNVSDIRITDRGTLIYPFVSGANTVYKNDFVDSEGAGTLECLFRANAPFASPVILGGEWASVTSGAYYLCQNGGAPIIVTGALFAGSGAAALLNVVAAPTAPVVIRDSTIPAISRTNASNGQYLSIQQNGKAESTVVANLWSCATANAGAMVDVTDCTTCTYGVTCTGGGVTYCREVCTGSSWVAQ